ncbi:hypothetical protein MTR67_052077 [Solanum verrucosum]|uniref:LRR-RLK n=1 Tax=Solanum verrucosum TaxID=315347 RepID=A0AAF0V682_SOLVR|nr:hypothetical protein MTR67_052077 [Solanum verrucosum]
MDNEIQKLKTNEDNLKSKASQQHDYKNAELRRSKDGKNPELKGDDGKLLKTHNICLNIAAGSIPKPLWNHTNIEKLALGYNHLEGPISDFFIFGKLWLLSLGKNNFDGQLELLAFKICRTQLKWLDFSSNLLTCPIPSNVSGLQNLGSLSLSSNHLNGNIPSCIFSLPSLEWLDLSDNHFSGNIRDFNSKSLFLVILKQNKLQVLNLLGNHLVGFIGKGKLFNTFENRSYQGNDMLCGFPLSKDCGVDEGVPQTTTKYRLDQEEEEEEGDSTFTSWLTVLMCYGCGLVIGLSIIYIMLSTQYPT